MLLFLCVKRIRIYKSLIQFIANRKSLESSIKMKKLLCIQKKAYVYSIESMECYFVVVILRWSFIIAKLANESCFNLLKKQWKLLKINTQLHLVFCFVSILFCENITRDEHIIFTWITWVLFSFVWSFIHFCDGFL